MAFDPAFLDELRARTPIAAVIGRRARLSRSGRNWKACCPFHGEKTPSFYIYDDHFHCFGCGVHGDVISFVMQSSGQSFLDAVTDLAREAGLELPRQEPAAREAAVRARTLVEVLDAAQRAYARRLTTAEGREGLAYLRGRGLSEATIRSFGLGWSGDGRGSLADELKQQGIGPELMAEAGLMRLDEAGRPKGELFFNRVTFPIRDRRGGLISFGGRTLGDGQPKYLNGPETRLFSKRLTLFALDRANTALREAGAGRTGGSGGRPADAMRPDLVVVEGYMDVIALQQAGFPAAVAPLGTALTPDQMEALWRVSAVPVLCFDGDAAGRRAAIKAAETALPLLDTERSLRFCRLPEGEDPDSLLRQQGAGAMRQLLQGARPIGDVLFELLSEGVKPDSSPEQRSALYNRLVEAATRIGNKSLAREYRETLTSQFFATFRSRRGPGRDANRTGRAGPPGDNVARLQSGPLPSGRLPSGPRRPPEAQVVRHERLRLLTAILLRHPELLHDVEEAYCGLELPEDLRLLREPMVRWHAHAGGVSVAGDGRDAVLPQIDDDGSRRLDSQALLDHLRLEGFQAQVAMVLGGEPLPLAEQVEPGDMPAEVEKRWWHFFGLLNFERLLHERDAAIRDWIERNDEPSHRRLRALSEVCLALSRGEQADEDGWG